MRIPPPVYALACVGILYAAHRWLPIPEFTFPGQWVLGGFVIVAGLIIDLLAVLRFLTKRTTINPLVTDKASTLVTGGLNRFSRNPMYLGMAIWIGGAGIGFGSLVTPLVVAGFVWLITQVQIIPEERGLEAKFGQAYRDYKSRVRRWI